MAAEKPHNEFPFKAISAKTRRHGRDLRLAAKYPCPLAGVNALPDHQQDETNKFPTKADLLLQSFSSTDSQKELDRVQEKALTVGG